MRSVLLSTAAAAELAYQVHPLVFSIGAELDLSHLYPRTMLSYRGRWMAQMSPIDEATYLDIIFKFPDDLVAQRGEFFSPEIREKFACAMGTISSKSRPAFVELIIQTQKTSLAW